MSRPHLAALPACKGLVVVPALAMGAPAKEVAMASACLTALDPPPSRRAHAAALPITPTTAGGWNL